MRLRFTTARRSSNFVALSGARLVNIRRTLQNAVHDRCMTEDQARQLLDYSKRTYYPERSYRHLLTCPALKSWPDRAGIEHYFLSHGDGSEAARGHWNPSLLREGEGASLTRESLQW